MSRHSRNCTAGTHFTYHEKLKAGHGTLRKRFGKDSQIQFGICCLCLSWGNDLNRNTNSMVITPSGYFYHKECIYSNLLSQKEQIKNNIIVYEKCLKDKYNKEINNTLKEEENQIKSFLLINNHYEHNISLNNINSTELIIKQDTKDNDLNDINEEKIEKKVIINQLNAQTKDIETIEEKRNQLKRTSFWAPEFTPENNNIVIKKPNTKTYDPMNNKIPLKLKHLMPVHIIKSCNKNLSNGSKENMVICALTKKEITHQQAVLLKPSGQIILESCLKELVYPSMKCPLTDIPLRKSDIILLMKGGTAYSSHSNVEAKKYRPSMT